MQNFNQQVFLQRCARIQAYINIYLHPKKTRYLVVSNMEKGVRSQGSEAFFNYLLNYEVAGPQILQTSSPINNCILVISINKFYWYCDDEPAVAFLIPFVQHLPNHAIICGQTLNVLTSDEFYQINGGQIKQMSNEDYDILFSSKDIKEAVIKYDKTSKLPPHIVFLKQIFTEVDEENVNIATPAQLAEVSSLQQILQEKQLNLVSIQQSIQFLLYGHVDAGCLKALQNVTARLQRTYTEIISVPNARKQDVLERAMGGKNSKSTVKIQDVDKIHIVDVNLQDPKLPVIYRMPFIILDQEIGSGQQEAVRLLGFVDHAMTKSGLAQLAQLLDNEENVGQTFKEYLNKKLLKDQPEAYRAPLQQAIEMMKLSIQRKQLFDAGEKLYGRYLMNIQLKIQLKYDNNEYTVIYGRSYIKCGDKTININDQLGGFVMEKPEFSLFDDRERICYSFKEKQLTEEEQNEIKVQSQNSVPCDINVCLLLHNNKTQLGELKRLQPSIKGQMNIEPFKVNMRLDDVNQSAEVYLQNQQLSKRYVQQIAIFSKIKEDQKFKPVFRNKNFYICSFDLQHLVDLFGDYLFGYLSYEYRYLLEEDSDRTIEGFAVEFVVPKGQMLHKLQAEMQSGDYQIYEELHKYKFLDVEQVQGDEFEQNKVIFEFEALRNDFLRVDSDYIFKGINNAGYIDALLKGSERPGKLIARKANALYAKSRLILISTPNGLAEYQLILSCLIKYFKQQLYGSRPHLLVVQTDEQMLHLEKLSLPRNDDSQSKDQIIHTYIVCCNECYALAVAAKFLECGSMLTCIACCPYTNTVNLLERDSRQIFQSVSLAGLLAQLAVTNNKKQKIYNTQQYNARIYSLEEQQEQIEREQENTIINYMNSQKQTKRVKSCANQYYIDNQEMFETLQNIHFENNVDYYGFFYYPQQSSFGNVIHQSIIRHEDELSVKKQVNLKVLSDTFKRPEIRLMFKQISQENAIFYFRFDRFIIEVYRQKFCIDLDPIFLLNEQTMQYMTTTVCFLDKQQQQYLTRLAQTTMNSLYLVIQSLCEETPQSSQKTNHNEVNWLEIKNYYKDLPPPPGYFYYYGMYMDWYGHIEHDRPDKKELINKYYKEILKKEVPGSLQGSQVSEIVQAKASE